MQNRWTNWVVDRLTIEYSLDIDLRFHDLVNARTRRMIEGTVS